MYQFTTILKFECDALSASGTLGSVYVRLGTIGALLSSGRRLHKYGFTVC